MAEKIDDAMTDENVEETLEVKAEGEELEVETTGTKYVVEGEEGVEEESDDPFAGMTKEEMARQIQKVEKDLEEEKNRWAQLLQQQRQVVQPMPQMPIQPQQPQESPEDRERRLNQLFLENPAKAAQLMTEELRQQIRGQEVGPLVQAMLLNQEKVSKELLVKDPDDKKFYEKWKDEIEETVRNLPPGTKLQNPHIYKAVLENVKSRHTDDLVNDLVAKKLKEYGIDPEKKTPVVPSLANRQTAAPTSPQKTKTVVVPRWVAEEAEKQGVEPGFYYERLKARGLVK